MPGVELRRQVWPYLLEHYRFDMSPAERDEKDRGAHMRYEDAISEWYERSLSVLTYPCLIGLSQMEHSTTLLKLSVRVR